ncbi:MAG: energy-converting hydrogenase subunit [Methanoculleus sp.]|nr:energy-converting hydrogenase subunit [Methanoculleus sp.]
MIALYLVAAVAVFAAIRAIVEKNTGRKLPYTNVMNFAVAGALVLLLDHPLSIVAAAAYFVGSTLEANAIASTYAGGMKR